MKNKIYCIGNAHLDPAWMWCWQEGSAEAKATIRSALDRMKEFDDFKFVCAGVSVYEWIEEFAPDMFEEIKQRVAEGRFIIAGGMYVQPDCNIPSGEGFARQTLYSQRYFFEKFGKTADTGYNVDSFGHNGNLPMILQKSGMKHYVYMRPSQTEMPMNSSVFRWESADGSAVTAYRIQGKYCQRFTSQKELVEILKQISDAVPDELHCAAIFYGVGNHGGGPTIEHIKQLKEYGDKHPETIVFSTLTDLFEDIERQKTFELPTHKGDLQHHASGCYAAYAPIKTAIRKAETSLISAEMSAMMANRILGRKYRTEEFKTGWKDVCFIHFHDICGGCCIKSAYHDAEAFAKEAESIAIKNQNNALQALSWAVDTRDASKGTPVVIFNPNPFIVEDLIKINLRITSAHDGTGNELDIQHTTSETLLCGRRTDSMIRVKVPALGYATYWINRSDAIHGIKFMAPEMRTKVDQIKHFLHFKSEVDYSKNALEDDYFKIVIDEKTGYLTKVFDKKNNRDMLAKDQSSQKKSLLKKKKSNWFEGTCGALPMVIDESDHDTWSHAKNHFDRVIGFFSDAKLEIGERGPLRASIMVTSTYGKSTLVQTFSLANDGLLGVNVKLDWHEKQKMLKLAYPLNLTETTSLYEIPFGAIERPTNGEEECGQMWIAVSGKEGGYGMLNDSKYSFSVTGNKMCITAIRSPYFGDHGFARYATEHTDVTDQGLTEFNYAITAFNGDRSAITRAARLYNTKPVVVIENNHEGSLPLELQGISVSEPNIIISALKRAEDGSGIILRAYETDGKKTQVAIGGALLPSPLITTFSPYTVNTYLLKDGESTWEKVLITEFKQH